MSIKSKPIPENLRANALFEKYKDSELYSKIHSAFVDYFNDTYKGTIPPQDFLNMRNHFLDACEQSAKAHFCKGLNVGVDITCTYIRSDDVTDIEEV